MCTHRNPLVQLRNSRDTMTRFRLADQPTTQRRFPAPNVTREQEHAFTGLNPITQPPVRPVMLRARDIESRVRHIVEREGTESPIYRIVDF